MSLLLLAAVAVVLGWFALGTGANVRRGNEALRWMQGGLKALGDKATVRWLGSTAVVLGIAEARPPFQSAELVVFLEARDLPWMWALGRLTGRRDTLIVRGLLPRPPAVELEAVRPGTWSERDLRPRLRALGLPARPAEGGLALHAAEGVAAELARSLLDRAGEAGLEVQRLSVRREEPHFQLHVPLPAAASPAAAFFEAVRALGDRAGRPA